MPSRWVTLGIIVFWVAATLWLVYREGWQKPSQPPPFTIDRTDEIGVQTASWKIKQGGMEVGTARTRVGRNADDLLYDATCDYSLLKPLAYRGLLITGLSSTNRVTPRGDLRELSCVVTAPGPWGPPVFAEIEARVEGRVLRPSVKVRDGRRELTPAAIHGRGGVLNLLHPLHKVAGLSAGRRWQVPLLDPVAVAFGQEPEGRGFPRRVLDAEVSAHTLNWHETWEPCWRIDLREPGGPVSGRVWVRVRDGLVLQQEVRDGRTEIVLKRKLLG